MNEHLLSAIAHALLAVSYKSENFEDYKSVLEHRRAAERLLSEYEIRAVSDEPAAVSAEN